MPRSDTKLSSGAQARALAAVVSSFALGALLGGLATLAWHTHAIIAVVPALALFVTGTRRIERAAQDKAPPPAAAAGTG